MKNCTNKNCKQINPQPISNFHEDKQKKDGLACWCKNCCKDWSKEYYKQNIEKIKENSDNYYKENRIKKLKRVKNLRKKYPWKYILKGIKNRCNNKNSQDYDRYGGRGIECRITEDEIKYLWFRDKAYLMDKQSIDRENNNGHYELSNCRFIEMSLNGSKDRKKFAVLQFDLKGNFIKEFESITAVARELNTYKTTILRALKRKNNISLGFKWKLKKENKP